MATNVTEKDKTLKEVIDWCEEQVARIDEKIPNASDEGFLAGERFALQAVAAHCVGIFGFHAFRRAESKRGMMSKDSEALYEFAHWLSEKGREAREELVYKQYTPWIDDVALGRLEAYDEAYKHCREMLGNADSIFSPKFDKETKQSEDTE
ncbi:hypothetical protein [Bifidobacterium catenulatum]|uniref:hypothetical protein n=2 Tax=Bifidobacterium catenulatum TaxID=1686 RepID=UPI003219BBBB